MRDVPPWVKRESEEQRALKGPAEGSGRLLVHLAYFNPRHTLSGDSVTRDGAYYRVPERDLVRFVVRAARATGRELGHHLWRDPGVDDQAAHGAFMDRRRGGPGTSFKV